jgi:hypothetical protein
MVVHGAQVEAGNEGFLPSLLRTGWTPEWEALNKKLDGEYWPEARQKHTAELTPLCPASASRTHRCGIPGFRRVGDPVCLYNAELTPTRAPTRTRTRTATRILCSRVDDFSLLAMLAGTEFFLGVLCRCDAAHLWLMEQVSLHPWQPRQPLC